MYRVKSFYENMCRGKYEQLTNLNINSYRHINNVEIKLAYKQTEYELIKAWKNMKK